MHPLVFELYRVYLYMGMIIPFSHDTLYFTMNIDAKISVFLIDCNQHQMCIIPTHFITPSYSRSVSPSLNWIFMKIHQM